MINASSDFVTALKKPIKQMYLKFEFYDSSMKYIDEFTKQVTQNDIGSISVDANRPIRRSFSFSLNNINGNFTWGENNLIWINKRVKVYIGLKLANEEIEYVPQGVFILSEPSDTHGFDGKKTTVNGQDKMYLMTDKRGKFVNQLTIQTGINIATAIKIIAQDAGETMFNFDTVTETVPYELTYQPEDNRYKALEELALLAKCEIFYDVNGYLRLKKINTDLSLEPIEWTYKYGDKNERFYAGNVRKMDETELSNHIRVLGGSSQTATVLYDLVVDETNPLWVDSPYSIQQLGRITYFHNSGNPDGLITTTDEAKWRAKYELMNRLGYSERVSMQIASNFLHEGNDVVQVEDSENNVTGRYRINSFQLPLSPQLMTVELRKFRQVITDWNAI